MSRARSAFFLTMTWTKQILRFWPFQLALQVNSLFSFSSYCPKTLLTSITVSLLYLTFSRNILLPTNKEFLRNFKPCIQLTLGLLQLNLLARFWNIFQSFHNLQHSSRKLIYKKILFHYIISLYKKRQSFQFC